MRILQTVMATTHVDRHNDRFELGALESMRDHVNAGYLPFIYNHDPRCPPLGRVTDAHIVPLDDGEFALHADVELFEEGPLPPLVGSRSISLRAVPSDGFLLTVDRTFEQAEFGEPVAEIAAIFGRRPELEVKKALEPIAVLTIGAGMFVVGKFAGAFFSKLGTDAAAALSAKLKAIFSKKPPAEERLLKFEFEFRHRGQSCRADVILTGPSDADIDGFFRDGLAQLDAILPAYLDAADGLVRLVFKFADGRARLEFAVRRDAYPVFPVSDCALKG